MLNFPVEKNVKRFYNYYFLDVPKPIIIEAYSKVEARDILKKIIEKLSDKYRESKIIGESVTIPLRGVSEKTVKDVKYIWVGEDKVQGGWLREDEYKMALIRSKNK